MVDSDLQRELLHRQRTLRPGQPPEVRKELRRPQGPRPAVAGTEAQDAQGGQLLAALLAPEVEQAHRRAVAAAGEDDIGALADQLAHVAPRFGEVAADEDGRAGQGALQRADDRRSDFTGASVEQRGDGGSHGPGLSSTRLRGVPVRRILAVR